MFIVTHRKFFFVLSALLVIGSIVAGLRFGLQFGTDFTGGSILEVSYSEDRPDVETVRALLEPLDLGEYSVRPTGEQGIALRSRELSLEEKNAILSALSDGGHVLTEERFNSIGPVVGESLKRKSYYSVSLVVLGIVLFITFAFRKVSHPVSSWKYGLATVISLAHDVIVPIGAYIVYGVFTGAQIDVLFVSALLATLGYSVHDTIVVFDRVREHLKINQERNIKEPFEKTVGDSVRQTMTRSINTSVTIFLVLVALYFVGSEATRHFTFVLLMGVVVGTYSSIFLAAPLLVTLQKLQKEHNK